MIFGSREKRRRREQIMGLYGRIAALARDPEIFTAFGVADTVEGRFEVLALHMALVLRRLGQLPPPADSVAQDLTDHFFLALDGALREIGYGDTGVPKRMKELAKGFYGRAAAYEAALLPASAADAVSVALLRNVYSGDPLKAARAQGLAERAAALDARLAGLALDDYLSDKQGLLGEASGERRSA